MTQNKKISVLIVDDSVTYRQFLRDALSTDDRIDVVSIASNGLLALPRVRHYKPDFIILDHEMPELTGIETLKEIRQIHPSSKVIMFSSHTTEGARVTMQALNNGAVAFVTKPNSSSESPVTYIERELLTLIIEIAAQEESKQEKSQLKEKVIQTVTKEKVAESARHTLPASALPGHFDVAAIGISTGGPVALRTLFKHLPLKLRGSLLIVQHMPPMFTKQMADSLKSESGINTVEATNGMKIEPATAYIAPGGFHMAVTKRDDGNYIQVLDTEPVNSCKPSVDVLFESVANVYNRKAVGIIMTGMGYDGYQGMIKMKAQQSYLIGQNKESCLVFGMPLRPTEEGLIQESLSIEDIAQRIRYLLGE